MVQNVSKKIAVCYFLTHSFGVFLQILGYEEGLKRRTTKKNFDVRKMCEGERDACVCVCKREREKDAR